MEKTTAEDSAFQRLQQSGLLASAATDSTSASGIASVSSAPTSAEPDDDVSKIADVEPVSQEDAQILVEAQTLLAKNADEGCSYVIIQMDGNGDGTEQSYAVQVEHVEEALLAKSDVTQALLALPGGGVQLVHPEPASGLELTDDNNSQFVVTDVTNPVGVDGMVFELESSNDTETPSHEADGDGSSILEQGNRISTSQLGTPFETETVEAAGFRLMTQIADINIFYLLAVNTSTDVENGFQRYRCPVCPRGIFKPTVQSKLKRHIEAHWRIRLDYKDVSIIRCYQKCHPDLSHFHCPECPRLFTKRNTFVLHLNAKHRAKVVDMRAEENESRVRKSRETKQKTPKVFHTVMAVIGPETLDYLGDQAMNILDMCQETAGVTYKISEHNFCVLKGSLDGIEHSHKTIDEYMNSTLQNCEQENRNWLELESSAVIANEMDSEIEMADHRPENENESYITLSDNLRQATFPDDESQVSVKQVSGGTSSGIPEQANASIEEGDAGLKAASKIVTADDEMERRGEKGMLAAVGDPVIARSSQKEGGKLHSQVENAAQLAEAKKASEAELTQKENMDSNLDADAAQTPAELDRVLQHSGNVKNVSEAEDSPVAVVAKRPRGRPKKQPVAVDEKPIEKHMEAEKESTPVNIGSSSDRRWNLRRKRSTYRDYQSRMDALVKPWTKKPSGEDDDVEGEEENEAVFQDDIDDECEPSAKKRQIQDDMYEPSKSVKIAVASEDGSASVVKRKRGRPRKTPVKDDVIAALRGDDAQGEDLQTSGLVPEESATVLDTGTRGSDGKEMVSTSEREEIADSGPVRTMQETELECENLNQLAQQTVSVEGGATTSTSTQSSTTTALASATSIQGDATTTSATDTSIQGDATTTLATDTSIQGDAAAAATLATDTSIQGDVTATFGTATSIKGDARTTLATATSIQGDATTTLGATSQASIHGNATTTLATDTSIQGDVTATLGTATSIQGGGTTVLAPDTIDEMPSRPNSESGVVYENDGEGKESNVELDVVKDEETGAVKLSLSVSFAPKTKPGKSNARGRNRRELARSVKKYNCEICGLVFNRCGEMTRHRLKAHNMARAPRAITVCDTCGKQMRQKHLKAHIAAVHKNEKPWTCTVCEKSFSTHSYLKYHMSTHSEERERPHLCSTCGRSFFKISQLQDHQNTHSGSRPYKCKHCSKTFLYRSAIAKHIMTHSMKKPFECHICHKAFRSKDYLRNHQVTHEPRSYQCPLCKRIYSHRHSLLVHSRRCPGAEAKETDVNFELPQDHRYLCGYCQEMFDDLDTIQVHLAQHVQQEFTSAEDLMETLAGAEPVTEEQAAAIKLETEIIQNDVPVIEQDKSVAESTVIIQQGQVPQGTAFIQEDGTPIIIEAEALGSVEGVQRVFVSEQEHVALQDSSGQINVQVQMPEGTVMEYPVVLQN